MQALRKKLNVERAKTYSDIACNKLLSFAPLLRSGTVSCYSSKPEELQTDKLIIRLVEIGKKVALPKVDQKNNKMDFYYINSPEKDLETGFMGIMEPKTGLKKVEDVTEIDFTIIPALSVDVEGNRIGFGGGFFDRYFKSREKRNILCGLVFDFQILECIPYDSRDVKLDFVISEKRIISCGKEISRVH